MASTATAPSIWKRGDQEVSLARLYAMRAVGLLGIYGLLPTIGRLVDHEPTDRGMLTAMVSGLWVMAFLIVRYPLKLVPLFLFEITWKLLWFFFFGLPQWWTGVGPKGLPRTCGRLAPFRSSVRSSFRGAMSGATM